MRPRHVTLVSANYCPVHCHRNILSRITHYSMIVHNDNDGVLCVRVLPDDFSETIADTMSGNSCSATDLQRA